MKKPSNKLGFILGIILLILGILIIFIYYSNINNPIKSAENAVKKTFNSIKKDNKMKNYKEFNNLKKFVLDEIDYKIISSKKIDDNTVNVKVQINAINVNDIIEIIEEISKNELLQIKENFNIKEIFDLNKYLKQINNKILNSLKNANLDKTTTTVDIVVNKTNDEWGFKLNKEIMSALFPGVEEIINSFINNISDFFNIFENLENIFNF